MEKNQRNKDKRGKKSRKRIETIGGMGKTEIDK